MRLTFGASRDVLLFLGGLGVLAHEMILVPEPRIALLTLAAGMIGLPATFLADRKFSLPGTPPAPESKPTVDETR